MMNPKENLMEHIYNGKPEYMPMTIADIQMCGMFYPLEQPVQPGKDIFGIPWQVTVEGPIPQPGFVMFDDIADWKNYVKFPDLDDYDFKAFAAAEAAAIPQADRKEKAYSLITACGLWERLIAFMGFENALYALQEDPDACKEFFEAMADFKIQSINKLIDAYGPDIFIICDDLSHARGLFMSPDTYRSLIKPAEKRIAEAISARGVIYQKHCCGKCEELIPDFIDVGAKMWHSAQKMNDIEGILDRYKGQLVVEGGWDTQGTASTIGATEEDIRKETIRCMESYKKPGFILCPALFNEQGNGFFNNDPRTVYIVEEWMKQRMF